jgi:hypothetical protein
VKTYHEKRYSTASTVLVRELLSNNNQFSVVAQNEFTISSRIQCTPRTMHFLDVNTPMRTVNIVGNTSAYSFCCLVLVAAIINSTVSLQMSAHISRGFISQPARRILGYQCANPKCLKLFANQHAYDQHRDHATRQGTLCASITMRDEVTGLRRSHTSTAALSTRRSTGWKLSTKTAPVTVR